MLVEAAKSRRPVLEVAPAVRDRRVPPVRKAADDICNEMEKGKTSIDMSTICKSTAPVPNEEDMFSLTGDRDMFTGWLLLQLKSQSWSR